MKLLNHFQVHLMKSVFRIFKLHILKKDFKYGEDIRVLEAQQHLKSIRPKNNKIKYCNDNI